MLDEYTVPASSVSARFFTEDDGEEESARIYLDGLDGGPDAVLVRHSEGARAERHFHHGSQVQLMLHGVTEFRDHRLVAPAVHYTDHNTAYGPFTMRDRHAMLVLHPRPSGQVFLDKPGAGRHRNKTGRQLVASAEQAPWEPVPERPGVRRRVLLAEASGLLVQLVECAPGTDFGVGGTRYGRFEFVLEGSVTLRDEPYDRELLRFVRGTREFAPLLAGPEGATAAVVCFDEDAVRGEQGGLSIADRLAQFREAQPSELQRLDPSAG